MIATAAPAGSSALGNESWTSQIASPSLQPSEYLQHSSRGGGLIGWSPTDRPSSLECRISTCGYFLGEKFVAIYYMSACGWRQRLPLWNTCRQWQGLSHWSTCLTPIDGSQVLRDDLASFQRQRYGLSSWIHPIILDGADAIRLIRLRWPMPATAWSVWENKSTALSHCTMGQAAVLAYAAAPHLFTLGPSICLTRNFLIAHAGQDRSSGAVLAHDVLASSTREVLEWMRSLNMFQKILKTTVTCP